MILTPWALALTLLNGLTVVLMLRASIPAVGILLTGEKKSSHSHLVLERQEMLADAALRLAFFYYLFSPLLLTAAAFDLARQIPGAMCALGTFNAGSGGFLLIFWRLSGVYFILAWMALYALDMRTLTTPFRRVRRVLIISICAWGVADTVLQTRFFASLDPHTVTSCCAVVFDPASRTVDNPAGVFARVPSAKAFAVYSGIYLAAGVLSFRPAWRLAGRVYGIFAPVYFFFGVAAMTSCISPYIYALFHHHCPFCILTGREGMVGIPMMLALYAASLFGWYAGIWQTASDRRSLGAVSRARVRGFRAASVVLNLAYVLGGMGVIGIYAVFGEFI